MYKTSKQIYKSLLVASLQGIKNSQFFIDSIKKLGHCEIFDQSFSYCMFNFYPYKKDQNIVFTVSVPNNEENHYIGIGAKNYFKENVFTLNIDNYYDIAPFPKRVSLNMSRMFKINWFDHETNIYKMSKCIRIKRQNSDINEFNDLLFEPTLTHLLALL